MLSKATAPHSVCLSTGRVLAPGETADIDPASDADLYATGQLTAVQGGVEATAPPTGASTVPVKPKPSRKPVEES